MKEREREMKDEQSKIICIGILFFGWFVPSLSFSGPSFISSTK
jgi:hypothetical protein